MRLWHQALIPYLDNQHLLCQHRECCALRGKGWGRKHTTVDYVFKYNREILFGYHMAVLKEMENRGYNYNKNWRYSSYRGKQLGYSDEENLTPSYYMERSYFIWYLEHNYYYLIECIKLLKQRNAAMDFDKIEKELGIHEAR